MATFTIPTVDISPYIEKHATADQRSRVISQIRNAALTSGFFQITGHFVPQSLQAFVFNAARSLFSLPVDTKLALKAVNGRGYEVIGGQTLDPGTKPDFKEGYYVGPPWLGTEEQGPPFRDFGHPNTWPTEDVLAPADFREPLLRYHTLMCDLAKTVMQILAEGLTESGNAREGEKASQSNPHLFDGFCEKPLAVLRLLHYPPHPADSGPKQFGAGAHTDFGAITLLLQDKQSGLQVLNDATAEWIDVPPNPDAYVVNIGDMLDMWTKGVYRSNTHRVLNVSGGDRYSVPFFFDGNLDYALKPLNLGSRLQSDGLERNGSVKSYEEGLTVEEFMRARYQRTYG